MRLKAPPYTEVPMTETETTTIVAPTVHPLAPTGARIVLAPELQFTARWGDRRMTCTSYLIDRTNKTVNLHGLQLDISGFAATLANMKSQMPTPGNMTTMLQSMEATTSTPDGPQDTSNCTFLDIPCTLAALRDQAHIDPSVAAAIVGQLTRKR
jgi:hypothetical protein